MIVSMFVIALAVSTHLAWIATIALILFLAGIAALLLSMVLTATDFSTAHVSIHYEVKQVCRLMHLK
ncbi:MAG: hypothetical protein ACRDEA_16030 [Microcystaceae cyanobacterium]